MEKAQLTIEDINFILESLKYTILKFEDYQGYPSYDYKQQRIFEATRVIANVNRMKKEWLQRNEATIKKMDEEIIWYQKELKNILDDVFDDQEKGLRAKARIDELTAKRRGVLIDIILS